MKQRVFKFNLDYTQVESQLVVQGVRQGDADSVKLVIGLSDGKKPIEMIDNKDKIIATLYAVKPDGKHLINSCNVVNNTVEYTLSVQDTIVVGCVTYQLVITTTENNTLKTVGSPQFTVVISPRQNLLQEAISSDEYNALEKALAQAREYNGRLEDFVNNYYNKTESKSRFGLTVSATYDENNILLGWRSGSSLSGGAFSNKNAKTAFIANEVVTIQSGAFKGCTNLETVYIDKPIEDLQQGRFHIQDGAFPPNVNIIYTDSFNGVTANAKAIALLTNNLENKISRGETYSISNNMLKPDSVATENLQQKSVTVEKLYGVDDKPIGGSLNLVRSTGIYSAIATAKSELENDLENLRNCIFSDVGDKTVATIIIYASILNVIIPASGWIQQENNVQGSDQYGNYIDIKVAVATSEQFPSVALHKSSLEIASKAGLCPTVQALDGKIRFWARNIPTEDMNATVALLTKRDNGNSENGGETYVLPTATEERLGGVKIGDGINVTEDGTISSIPSDSATNEEVNEMLDEVFKETD